MGLITRVVLSIFNTYSIHDEHFIEVIKPENGELSVV